MLGQEEGYLLVLEMSARPQLLPVIYRRTDTSYLCVLPYSIHSVGTSRLSFELDNTCT
jgi:hypothetical protein